MGLAGYVKVCIGSNGQARFARCLSADGDVPSLDHRLGSRSTWGQAPLDQGLVETHDGLRPGLSCVRTLTKEDERMTLNIPRRQHGFLVHFCW